jgi:hypothetical protein
MKLPNCQHATVAREKVTEYLLATTHPRGGQKAVFFMRCGFSQDEWQVFADALKRHACEHEVANAARTDYGTLYRIDGLMDVPNGGRPLIRSVWMIDVRADTPRLISAYPI